VADHVHLLVRLSATISIADLVKQLKGSSAHLVTHKLVPGGFFKWQAGYGAVTVSPRHLDQVSNYIARQRERHAANSLLASLEPPTRSSPPKQS
jgi:REP element-mobilizing transposase RayT